MTAHTFTHEFTLDYIDWRGREHECEARIRYTYDGVNDPDIIEVCAMTSDDRAQDRLDDIADDVVADICNSDYADWAGEDLPTASEATVPMVTA